MDATAGGRWRFVLRDPMGRVFAFQGAFEEVAPPERVRYTMEIEALPGHSIVETVEFEDLGEGNTRVTFTSMFQSQDDRDAAVRWGVRDGALETADRFAQVLERCSAGPAG
jgi:uncharacterized protein YndB with AHSA1/START domain